MATKAKPNQAQLADLARESAVAMAQSDLLGTEAVDRIKEALHKADFDLWTAIANVWKQAYAETRKCAENGADKAWSRLIAAAELVKPKATNAAATKMQERLKAQEAARKAMQSKAPEVLKDMASELAKQAAEGDTKAAKAIADIHKELKRRDEEATKAERDALKSERDRVIDMLKKCENRELLARIESLLAADAQAKSGVDPSAVVRATPPGRKTATQQRKAA